MLHAVAISLPLSLMGAALQGCGLHRDNAPDPSEEVPVARYMSELDPTGSPGKRAQLLLAGTKVPVEVATSTKGDEFDINLLSDGSVFEQESYSTKNGAFGVQSVAGEVYTPPIPILKFPLRSGQGWHWKGSSATGIRVTRAEADALPMVGPVFVGSVPVESVVVKVKLFLYEESAATPKERDLTFTFAKGRGLFKREYGPTSTREPATP